MKVHDGDSLEEHLRGTDATIVLDRGVLDVDGVVHELQKTEDLDDDDEIDKDYREQD